MSTDIDCAERKPPFGSWEFLGTQWIGFAVISLMPICTLASDSSQPVDFARDIRPLLTKRCIRCHGPRNQQGGLRLDLRPRALMGGDSGVAITPGAPSKSPILQRIARVDPDTAMPPVDEGTPLSAQEVALIRRWIETGAEWIGDMGSAGSDHWAFQPIRRPDVPRLAPHPIDAFVLARLRRERLAPSPPADRSTLLRRLSLDLLGLPPRPKGVQLFLDDVDPSAYARLVDATLASPHFGERWAKHWLDLARFADTDGYSGERYRKWAWRWRHWVIESLNRDMPFDQFTIEQIAGDLLPDASVEQHVATGFHRNFLHTREMDADKEEFRVRKVVDCANVTGSTWLGLTVGCAQCHSHKFDPITQREYFGLYAFFNSLTEVDVSAPTSNIAFVTGSDAPGEIHAQTLAELAEPRPTRVHLRGDFLAKGDAVVPHVPSVLPDLKPQGDRANRLDLARWLVSPNHPLTARVAVNRLWQHLFGHGLVRTENDFGIQGTPPTHPELLDWLACEFIECGWSQKRLIRLIVTSDTYRQSSTHRSDLAQVDPENRLLARQSRRRHSAEVLRDNALFVAGLLDSRVGGPSFRPAVARNAGEVVMTKWKPERTADEYRRGIYIVVQRTIPLPYLMMFDAPDGNAFCSHRAQSNTPTQALTLLNDPLFLDCARELGRRLLEPAVSPSSSAQGDKHEAADEEHVQRAFLLALGRRASTDELLDLRSFLTEQRNILAAHPSVATQIAGGEGEDVQARALWTCLARVLMNTDEFLSRE